jgi:hypothetical protein
MIPFLYCTGLMLLTLSCGSGNMAPADKEHDSMEQDMEIQATYVSGDTLYTRYTVDESIFPNPERGFYLYSDLSDLDSDIGTRRQEGHTLRVVAQ